MLSWIQPSYHGTQEGKYTFLTGDHRSMWDYRIRNDQLDILKGMGLSKKKTTHFISYLAAK